MVKNQTPDKIIKPDGRPHFGIFPEAVRRINPEDFDHRTPMEKPVGFLARRFGVNCFQYFGVISEELIFGCALADMSYMGVAFFYVYHPASGKMKEYSFRSPLSMGMNMSRSVISGRTQFKCRQGRISMGYRDAPREKDLRIELAGGISVNASFSESEPAFHPMSICTKAGYSGWVYAHKVAGVAARGVIECPFGRFDLENLSAMAHHDFSAGFMRRETFWNWACLSGEAAGRKVGLNVSCGVNETSFTENCFWLDGTLYKVDLVDFEFDRRDPDSPWRVASNDGQVALDFVPAGRYAQKMNLLFLATNFKQIFGRFDGRLRPPDGEEIEIKDMWGFVEEQYAKW